MGIDADSVAVLALARAVGANFSSTVTLGRQSWFVRAATLRNVLISFGHDLTAADAEALVGSADRPSTDGLFELLGAKEVDAIDASDFEGASIVHDLNAPVPARLKERFSLVFDGGTLEHVFDVRQAVDNLMRLVAPGGHVISAVPANNQMGHGFYQFSPELYFRLFCPENGFEIQYLLIKELSVRNRWYQLTDPAVIGRRLTLSTLGEANMFLIARRTGEAGLTVLPQQSDYVARWDERNTTGEAGSDPAPPPSKARRLLDALPLSASVRQSALEWARQGKILRGSVVASPGVCRVEPIELAAAAQSGSQRSQSS